MTHDPKDRQGGLPEDAGNNMSERAGDAEQYVRTGIDTAGDQAGQGSEVPQGDTLDRDGSGTTFDAGTQTSDR
ncbi:hypothetical protein GCM10008955_15150 [Deinococcus malanensis]|uniref:Uncharacterized protein n=1 Tax=Deinococcus malanensis TaxID=1706855 RepID=A0ABQ2ERA5_9DEIO|nr:hypothetical protein [Deinococcus malanensis]GGK22625.1 hypothetical protein GCM10008955_15150 [Deinococcus malanensis]